MSLNHRINKLEHKHGHGFRVAYPVLLDASDQKFTECPDKSQIAAVLFKYNAALRQSLQDSVSIGQSLQLARRAS